MKRLANTTKDFGKKDARKAYRAAFALLGLLSICVLASCASPKQLSESQKQERIEKLESGDDFMVFFKQASLIGTDTEQGGGNISEPVERYIKARCANLKQTDDLLKNNGFIGPWVQPFNRQEAPEKPIYDTSFYCSKKHHFLVYEWRDGVILFMKNNQITFVKAFVVTDMNIP